MRKRTVNETFQHVVFEFEYKKGPSPHVLLQANLVLLKSNIQLHEDPNQDLENE